MTGRSHPPENEQPTGSPGDGEPVFLVVGRLRRPHGLRGELIMEVLTDFPERLRPGIRVMVGDERRQLRLRTVRSNDTTLLVSFKDLETPEAAAELRNQLVYVRAEDRPPLPEGEYYHHQLIGLRVVDEIGKHIGDLSQIIDTAGANDVYVIRTGQGKEVLVPAIQDVILEIDLDRGEMLIRPLPGLLD